MPLVHFIFFFFKPKTQCQSMQLWSSGASWKVWQNASVILSLKSNDYLLVLLSTCFIEDHKLPEGRSITFKQIST